MAEYTPNYSLYKPNRLDNDPVDTTLTDNFTTIDTEIKNRKDETDNLDARIDSLVLGTGDSNPEIVEARGPFDILSDRLNNTDSSLAENEKKFTNIVYVENYPMLGIETDDTERIKRALSALVALGGGELFFTGISYTISSQIDFDTTYSNITLKGIKGKTIINGISIPTATSLSQRTAFNLMGTIDTLISVTTSINQWSNTITLLSTTGLQPDDLILITNNEPYAPGTTATTWKKGELNVIKSVDSATQITLVDSTLFSYDSTQSAKIQKINPILNVQFKDLDIKMGGVGSGHNGIKAFYTRNLTIERVGIDGAEDNGVNLYAVYNVDINKCKIENSTSPTPIGNSGYGVGVSGTRYVRIQNNNFKNCRHFVAGGGDVPAALVDVIGNYGTKSILYGFDCHEPCFYWTFKHNKAVSCNGGIVIRGQHITVESNEIIASTDKGICVMSNTPVTEQYGVVVRNNKVRKSTNQGVHVDGSNALMRDIIVNGNVVVDSGSYGIEIYNFKGLQAHHNEVITSANGIHIYGVSTTVLSEDVQLHGNKVRDSSLHGIYVYACKDVSILSPKIDRSFGGIGIFIYECVNTETLGGIIKGSKSYGIQIQNGSNHSINGTKISECADATSDAIRVLTTSDLSIVNTITTSNPRYGIYVTGSNYVMIVGNNARGNANATKIVVDGTATSLINQNNLIA
jgi:hypothetical protein